MLDIPGSVRNSGDDKSIEESDEDSATGSNARKSVGEYAASTALAVKESLPPEGVILLLACLVGLLTGGSVVLFNLAVRLHAMLSIVLNNLKEHSFMLQNLEMRVIHKYGIKIVIFDTNQK